MKSNPNNFISFLNEKEQTLNIKKGEVLNINLVDIFDANLDIFLQENSVCNLRIFYKNEKNSLVLHGNLTKNSALNIYFADFSSGDSTLSSNVILLDENAKSSFKFSSLTKNEDHKKYSISFSHIGEKTVSELEGYSVNMDSSRLKVEGVSHIEKDSIKSKASQKIRSILFDETSSAIANPILKIDCDDIEANHACAIGSLNDDHLFYLLSRGIPLNDAKKLITYGYLNPIVHYFDEDDQKELKELIEGGI